MCLLMAISGLLLLFCLGLFYLITFAFDFSFLNWFNFCFWLIFFCWFFFVGFIFCWFYFQMIFLSNDFFHQMIYFSLNPFFSPCVYNSTGINDCVHKSAKIFINRTQKRSLSLYILICEPKLRKRNTNQENQHRKGTLWRSHKAIQCTNSLCWIWDLRCEIKLICCCCCCVLFFSTWLLFRTFDCGNVYST